MAKPTPKNANNAPANRKEVNQSGRPAGLVTWVAVGVVVVIVAALVVVKIATGSSSSVTGGWEATSSSTVTNLTTVPSSVFDTVGIDSPVMHLTPPEVHLGEPQLMFKDPTTGKTLPGVFYFGSEYCPFCAAQRWPTIVALSRFGTWSTLGNTSSSGRDIWPATPTFTFQKSTYSSPYLVLQTVEEKSNQINALGTDYTILQKPTAAQLALITKYDRSEYFPTMSPQYAGSIPFLTIGNRIMWAGSSISPSSFQGQVRDDIAKNLTDTTNPISQSIIAASNYISAGICSQTNQQPSTVCNSKGVQAAKRALHL
ncbi:unannotated protein [freshwater metagenome]|uniref:Unannotated protein n=1 Tax=freshwater metagenome TaxID=449393 RepID=A0A6J7E6X9_9ZZZZ|nr:DUF929 family protein [Actinomycetota bacterium]MUH58601.1 DUF929 domain-containing protein [Actinomycetota bacterium]